MNCIKGNDIYLTRGDTVPLKLYLEDEGGNKYNLEDGDTATFTVKKTTNDNNYIILKENIQQNDLEFEISHNDTKDLNYGEYVYDVQINFSNGDIETVIPPSKFILTEEVTF